MSISELVEYVNNSDNHGFLTLVITSVSLGITIIIMPIYRILSGWRQAKHIRKIVYYRLTILSDHTLPESPTNHSDFQEKLYHALQGMTFDLKAALTDYSSNLSHNKKRDVRRLCNNIDKDVKFRVYPRYPFSPEHRSTEYYRNLVAKELREIKWIKLKWIDTLRP